MFPNRFFSERYFSDSYWPIGEDEPSPIAPAERGGDLEDDRQPHWRQVQLWQDDLEILVLLS